MMPLLRCHYISPLAIRLFIIADAIIDSAYHYSLISLLFRFYAFHFRRHAHLFSLFSPYSYIFAASHYA
jgi:hypothetical protein